MAAIHDGLDKQTRFLRVTKQSCIQSCFITMCDNHLHMEMTQVCKLAVAAYVPTRKVWQHIYVWAFASCFARRINSFGIILDCKLGRVRSCMT